MEGRLLLNKKAVDVRLTSDKLIWSGINTPDKQESLCLSDVVGVEVELKKKGKENVASGFTVYYVKRKGTTWRETALKFTGQQELQDCKGWAEQIQTSVAENGPNRPKQCLVMINPASGNSKSEAQYDAVVKPLLALAGIQTDVYLTQSFDDALSYVKDYDLSTIDSILVMGGDGTFSQVLNGLVQRSQIDVGVDINDPDSKVTPPKVKLGFLPSGTGCGLSNTTVGVIDLQTSVLQIIVGNIRPFNMFSVFLGDEFFRFGFLLVGYGTTTFIIHCSEKNRQMGKMRYPYSFLYGYRHTVPYHADIELLKPRSDATPESLEWHRYDHPGIDDVHYDIMVFPGDFKTFKEVTADMTMFNFRRKSIIGAIKMLIQINRKRPQDPNFCHTECHRGIRINVKNKEELPVEIQHINIDGDPYLLKNEKIEIRQHADAFTIYGHTPDYAKTLDEEIQIEAHKE